MTNTKRWKLGTALTAPILIYIACAFIGFSSAFKSNPSAFSLAITLDMVFVAPIVYYLLIRNTATSKLTVTRVFIVSVLLAGMIISKNNNGLLQFIKTWISPLLELTLIGFIGWKFYAANAKIKKTTNNSVDFLMHCRTILKSVFGAEKPANIIASEIAVFFYCFNRVIQNSKDVQIFSTYKGNGIRLLLYTFLCLFVIETAGMHFVFMLWNHTVAWILTGLSIYTSLQLFAHIRALSTRPTMIVGNDFIIRHGLMGGDVVMPLSNIESIVENSKLIPGKETVKIAFINGLEKHNIAIFLKEPVTVIKGFGISRTASILLISIDQKETFIAVMEQYMTSNISI